MRKILPVLLVLFSLTLAACAGQPSGGGAATEETNQLSGDVVADGSSTVYPITVAVAEEFAAIQPDVRVSVGLSGTGGGFEKFCNGETDISDASRPIRDDEAAACAASGIEYTEFQIALDGLTVMVNPANDFVQCLSPEQLAQIFAAGSSVVTWADVDPAWPAEPIQFFVPDPDSGTRDYFIEVMERAGNLEDADLRADSNTTFSSDDNILEEGIANNENALGFFGFAYYIHNTESVRAVAIQNDAGDCVLPSDETVSDGTYNPLSRPLFIYVNNASARENPQVAEFVRYYLSEGALAVMADVGYSLPPEGTFEDDLAALDAMLGQ